MTFFFSLFAISCFISFLNSAQVYELNKIKEKLKMLNSEEALMADGV